MGPCKVDSDSLEGVNQREKEMVDEELLVRGAEGVQACHEGD
jgi:hypothetical protein